MIGLLASRSPRDSSKSMETRPMELVVMETYTDEIFVFVFAAEYWSGGGGGQVHPATPRRFARFPVPVAILADSVKNGGSLEKCGKKFHM